LAEAQIDRLNENNQAEVDERTENNGAEREALDMMLSEEYSPPEIVNELAKCILGMLHYRILSWA
jgi:hypothetical protein